MPAEQVYPYRAQPMTMIWVILFFGAGGLFMLHTASGNARGLLINGFIQLRPDEATIFDYVIATLCLAFVPLGLVALYISLTRKTVLVLGPSGITVPNGIRRQERTVAYADIKSIQHRAVRSQQILTVTPRSGKAISIAASMLPSKSIFTAIRADLAARTKAAQQL
jgi:hypothetical protein